MNQQALSLRAVFAKQSSPIAYNADAKRKIASSQIPLLAMTMLSGYSRR